MRKITLTLCLTFLVLVHNGTADFIASVNTPVNNPTSQQVVEAATASFLNRLDLERAKSNSILNVVQYVLSALLNIEWDTGKDLVTDFFLEGTAGVENMVDFLKFYNAFTADIVRDVVRTYPDEAKKVYTDCFLKKVNSNALPAIVNGVKDIISKGLSAESNFTAAASKCIQGQRETLEACLATASSSSLPIVAENVINTKELAAVAYECINKAADRLRTLGKLTYEGLDDAVSDDIQFNLPPKFDSTNKTLSVAIGFVYPISKIYEVSMLLGKAKKEAWEALNGRRASLVFVRAYLQPAVNDALAVLDKIKVESSASLCLTNAKQAVVDNANSRAKEIIQLNLALPPPPSEKELVDVEKAFFEKKVAEGLLYSWAQCVIGKSRYIFDQKKLICCLQESQSDYNFFLEGIKISLDNFIRRSIYVKALINQSAVYGERAFKKQLDTDLLALERCMKKNTKLAIDPSVFNFV